MHDKNTKRFSFLSIAIIAILYTGIEGCAMGRVHEFKSGKTDVRRSIENVLEDSTNKWMTLPGVIGTAQGETRGKPCIIVMVKKKNNALLKKIPDTVEGYAVIIEETGEIKALDSASRQK